MSTSISPDPFPSRDVQHEISRGHDRVDTLVVDAAPLIKGNRLEHLASNFVTIPEVLGEIRDRQARSAMATLPFELKVRAPSEEAMKHVIAFSKKTGDFATLSITDLKILALTYMLEREAKGVSHLRTEPVASTFDDTTTSPGQLEISSSDTAAVANTQATLSERSESSRSTTVEHPKVYAESAMDPAQIPTCADWVASEERAYHGPISQGISAALIRDGYRSYYGPVCITVPFLAKLTAETTPRSGGVAENPAALASTQAADSQFNTGVDSSADRDLQAPARSILTAMPPSQSSISRPTPADWILAEERNYYGPVIGGWHGYVKSSLKPNAAEFIPSKQSLALEPAIHKPQVHQASFSLEAATRTHVDDKSIAKPHHPTPADYVMAEERAYYGPVIGGWPQPSKDVSSVVPSKRDAIHSQAESELRSEAPHERLGSNDDAVSTPGSDAPKTKRRRHRGKKQPQEDKPIHLNLPDRTISKNKRSQPMDEVPSLDEDDGGEWITPANISKFKAQNSGLHADHEREPENIPVACITSDFAMQNVLLQMGLRLISVDGFAITHIKNWVLRCHACFKSTKDMERRFCPTCGNNTLIRTSVSVDANGNTIYHLKKNFQYRTRGTIWSIPEPKGGRRNTDVVLREDQREYQRALQYQKRQKQGSEDINDPDAAMFGAGQKNLMKNSQQLGTLTIGSGRRNPNERRRRR